MAVTLTGADGLFARLGTLEDFRQKIATHQALIDTEVDDILDEYNNDRDHPLAILNGHDGFKTAQNGAFAAIRATASKTIIAENRCLRSRIRATALSK